MVTIGSILKFLHRLFQMTKLLEMLARSCDSLLLFTQNVRRVSVYHLLDHHEPHQANLLYAVSKEPVKYIRMSVYFI